MKNIMQVWKMRSLKHYAKKTGMICRWNGCNIEGYNRQFLGWEIVFRGDLQ